MCTAARGQGGVETRTAARAPISPGARFPWGRSLGAIAAAAVVWASPVAAAVGVPLFPAASDGFREGFVRVINHSTYSGEVRIEAIDDGGRAAGPVTLEIAAGATVHFNSRDLERGNRAKGLSGGVGTGDGDWRLDLESDLDIEALAYVRTEDGFLTAMHDVVKSEGGVHRVPVFNPASNADQVSRLRIVNPGDGEARVEIRGTDDRGDSPGAALEIAIPAGAARTLDARELESGVGGRPGLGDGAGKWRLEVKSAQPIRVMSLLDSPTRHLSNLSTVPAGEDDGVRTVPFFPAAGGGLQGFVRVVNRSDAAGEIRIMAFDETDWDHEQITLSLDANAVAHFNSEDLQNGNAAKGLSGGIGSGEGDWRLEFRSDLDLDVLAYVRTGQGFLTAMHDVAPGIGSRRRVVIFNPGSNESQVSQLRIINSGEGSADVVIRGIDGDGARSAGEVRLTVPAGRARTYTAQQLEWGAEELDGALDDGAGKWRLDVRSEVPVAVMSLLASPTGHLTNLSTAPGRGDGATVREVFDALVAGPVVESKCVACHVAGGESSDTRLVFVPTAEADHRATNLAAIRNFVSAVDDGAGVLLEKIQGIGHGGGEQVPADSRDFRSVARLLDLLEREPPGCADAACDRDALVALYEATNGPNWYSNANWGSVGSVDTWHGVETGVDGRVVGLRLDWNGLSGPFPGDLANLTELDALDLSGNDFRGGLPAEIGGLRALRRFRCGACGLSGELPAELGDLGQLELLDMGLNRFQGEIPPELGGAARLRSLYLHFNGLSGEIPGELGDLKSLVELGLNNNALTGEIPEELSGVGQLAWLDLSRNLLTGLVPKWLGSLPDLQYLSLARNTLVGEIPPELGQLASLQHLDLHRNFLVGTLPARLGDLAELRWLDLASNLLEGEVPAWLAELQILGHLSLANNLLTGGVPPALGDLHPDRLDRLDLGGNLLVGEIPAALSRIRGLRELALNDNRLTGKLPRSLTAVDLQGLDLGGNDICVDSDDEEVKRWLRGIPAVSSRIANCRNPHPVYLVQSVQSFGTPATLVAGRPALLRVFLASEEAVGEEIPTVNATFYDELGEVMHEAEIAAAGTLPERIDESSLAASADIEIPGRVIRPGVEMMIEVQGGLPGLPSRIPAQGRIALDIEEMPPLPLTLVPFLEEGSPDYTVVDIAQAFEEQGLDHPLLHPTADLLPIHGLDLTVHETVWTSTVSASALLGVVETMRAAEGGTGYWLGMLGYGDARRQGSGVANVGGWTAYSEPDPHTIAHELGHAMNLWHAPCGGAAGPDRWFPDPRAYVGSWGWDRRYGLLVPPNTRDFMSYCDPWWIGEFGFSRATAFRMGAEAADSAEDSAEDVAASREKEPALLLWGGVDERGKPYLRPSFLIDAVAEVPPPGDDYVVSGRGADGTAFSVSFDMPPLPDKPDESVFVITLPVTWTARLESIRLQGGDKAATLDLATSDPMTILRDPGTGQVRAVLERPAAEAVGTVPGGPLEVLESLGIATP